MKSLKPCVEINDPPLRRSETGAPNIIGGTIDRILQKFNLTQGEFAESIDVSKSLITKWKTGIQGPGRDIVEKISRIYGLSAKDIIGKGKEIKCRVTVKAVIVPAEYKEGGKHSYKVYAKTSGNCEIDITTTLDANEKEKVHRLIGDIKK